MDEYVYMCLSTCEHVYTFLYRPEVISQGALYLDFGGQCLSLALSLRILLSCHRTLSHLPDTRITDGHYHACLSWVLGTERRSSYSLSDHFTNPVPTPNLWVLLFTLVTVALFLRHFRVTLYLPGF